MQKEVRLREGKRMIATGRRDEAARLAGAQLHDALRSYRQYYQSLSLQGVKEQNRSFFCRLIADVAKSAIACVDVLQAEGSVCDRRRKELLSLLQIEIPALHADATVPLAAQFHAALQTQLWRSPFGSSARRDVPLGDAGEPSDAVEVVPIGVTHCVGRLLWTQGSTAAAVDLLWRHGVESVCAIPGDAADDAPKDALRRLVMLSGVGTTGDAPSTAAAQSSALKDCLEMWALTVGSGSRVAAKLSEIEGVGRCLVGHKEWDLFVHRLLQSAELFPCAGTAQGAVSSECRRRRERLRGALVTPSTIVQPSVNAPPQAATSSNAIVAPEVPSRSAVAQRLIAMCQRVLQRIVSPSGFRWHILVGVVTAILLLLRVLLLRGFRASVVQASSQAAPRRLLDL